MLQTTISQQCQAFLLSQQRSPAVICSLAWHLVRRLTNKEAHILAEELVLHMQIFHWYLSLELLELNLCQH